MNKPVDVIHQLKLDNTFIMERQTLGNQTAVPIFLYDDSPKILKQEPRDKDLERHKVINNNNFTSIGNSSTFSTLNDQIINIVPIKNEPTTSYEHEYCYNNVTIEQEVLDIIDDFTIKQECDAKVLNQAVQHDHAYNLPADKEGLKNLKKHKSPVKQAYNELIYGLGPRPLRSGARIVKRKVIEKVNTTPEKPTSIPFVKKKTHFKSSMIKPVDVIHQLKLDNTFMERQTLGNQTTVPIFLYDDSPKIPKQEPIDKSLEQHKVINNNNFTSIGNSSTFSILDDQIINIVPIKNEPITSYEHEYCCNNVTIEQEVLDIIDDFTIKEECDAKVLNQAVQHEKINCSICDHTYNLPPDKEGLKSLKKHKSPVKQVYNELIYGLGPHYLNPVRSRARICKRKVTEKVNTTPEKPTSIPFIKKKTYFKSSMINPVDVIHQLKLDNTFMERQTLGNQTTVPNFLYDDSPKIPSQEPIDKGLEQHKVINNNNFTSMGNLSTFSILKKTYFNSSMIKPVDAINQLKLDNTLMERQMLGNETTVPIFLYDDSPKIPKQKPIDKGLEQHKVINNNNFTSIGNSSTFSILNDQIISTIKNEPTTSHEHDCCYDNVTIKQEVLDIIDDFTIKEKCDAKAVQLNKKYCSTVIPASLIVQLKNRNCSIRDHAYNLPADKKGLKRRKNLVVPVMQAYNELIYGLGPHYLVDHVRPPKVVEKVNTTPEKEKLFVRGIPRSGNSNDPT